MANSKLSNSHQFDLADIKSIPILDTNDEIQSLNKDYEQMPFCSEKLILKLILYYSLKVDRTFSYKFSKNEKSILKTDFNSLDERIDIENLLKHKFQVDNYENIKNYHQYSAEENLSNLKIFLNSIREINIQELLRLTKSNNDAINKIKDKDVYLLFGPTGAGKSTTLHFLGGSKMEEQLIDGKVHILPVNITNTDLKDVKTGLSAIKSETRLVIPVKIPIDASEYGFDNVMFCDLPGFGDTNGPEIDISNSIAIDECIKVCSGIRPIIFISSKYGDRLQLLSKLTQTLNGMFNNMEAMLTYFDYIFTKYPEKERAEVKKQLQKINEELEEDIKNNKVVDKSFNLIIKDNIFKSRKRNLIVLDPVNDDYKEVLGLIIDNNFIKNPSRQMNISLSFESKSKVEKQVEKHFDLIERVLARLEKDPTEFELASFKINELLELKKIIKQNDIDEKFDALVVRLVKEINKENQNCLKMFNRKIENNEVLSDMDLTDYSSCVNKSRKNEEILKILDENVKSNIVELFENLDKQSETILAKIKTKNIEYELNEVKIMIDNLLSIKELAFKFDLTIENAYLKAKKYLIEKVNELSESKNSTQTKNDFNKIIKELNRMKLVRDLLNKHDEKFDQSYSKQKMDLLAKFGSLTEEAISILNKDILEDKDCDKLNEINNFFKAGIKNIETKVHLPDLDLNEELDKIEKSVYRVFELLNKDLSENININLENKQSLKLLESSFLKLRKLREITDFKNYTKQEYESILDSLGNLMKKLAMDVDKALVNLESNLNQRFISSIKLINELRWSEKYLKHVYVWEGTRDSLSEFIELQCRNMNSLNIDIENVEEIEKACKIYKLLNELQPVENFFSELTGEINKIKACFEDVMNKEMDLIKANILKYSNLSENRNIDFYSMSTFVNCIKTIENFKLTTVFSQILDIKQSIKTFLCEYLSKLEVNKETLFTELKDFKENISENSKTLVCSFENLNEIIQYEKSLQKMLPNNLQLKQLKEEYTTNLMDLFDEIEKSLRLIKTNNNITLLNQRIDQLKVLKKLDKYLDEEKKFSKLINENTKKVFDEKQNLVKICEMNINNNKFQDLLQNLNNLKKHQDDEIYGEMRKKFEDKIIQLCRSCVRQARNLDKYIEGELNDISQNYELIEETKANLKEHLSIVVDIENHQNNIKKNVLNFARKYLEGLKNSIARFDSNKENSSLLEIKQVLKNNFHDEALLNDIEKILENPFEILLDSMKKFETISIDEYNIYSPKEIYQKLSSSENENYLDAKKKFKLILINKFKKLLEEVKKDNSDKKVLKACDKCLNFIPDEIKEEINGLIFDFKQDMKTTSLKNFLDSQKKANNIDFVAIEQKYTTCKQNNDENDVEYIVDFVKAEKDAITCAIESYDTDQNIDNLLENMQIFYRLKNSFSRHFSNFDSDYNELEKKISSIFDTAQTEILTIINNVKKDNFLKNNLLKNFDIVEKISLAEKKIIFSVDPDFNTKFSNVVAQLNKILSEEQRNVIEAINSIAKLDASLILKSLDSIKFYSEFIRKLNAKNNMNLNLLSYEEIHAQLLNKIKSHLDVYCVFEYLTYDNKENNLESIFDNHYEKLNKQLLFLNEIKDNLLTHFESIDYDSYKSKMIDSNLTKLKALFDQLCKDFENLSLNNLNSYNNEIINNFNTLFYNLASFEKKVNYTKPIVSVKEVKKKLFSKLLDKINQLYENAEKKEIQAASKIFIDTKGFSQKFVMFNSEINEILEQKLNEFVKIKGFNSIGSLALCLKESPIGSVIVSEFSCFEAYNRSVFNGKIKSQGIAYVLDNIADNSNKIDISLLRSYYETFDKMYNDLIEKYLRPEVNFSELKSNLLFIINKVKLDITQTKIDWDIHIQKELPSILAYLFAFWTLLNSNKFFQQNRDYLIIPHSAQVIAIFRMLDVGYKDGYKSKAKKFFAHNFQKVSKKIFEVTGLRNNLVEIGTGEGKSITLGITAATLALLGFDVNCVCYSKYLSERDHTAFKILFDKLDLSEHIHYGTFNQICEDSINEFGDIRNIVKNTLLHNKVDSNQTKKEVNRPRVLLIDEVDVFFSKDFYGNSYNPVLLLNDESISSLVDKIWEQRSMLSFSVIKNTPEYVKCCTKFSSWTNLIEEAVKDIIIEFSLFTNTNDYLILNDKIGYKEQDTIDFNIRYGYKTLYTYLMEHEKGKISTGSLNENKNLLIKLGSFSYAEIPNNKFHAILGVTGTLKSINDKQKDIIENVYNIKFATYMPSIYGRKNVKFDKKDDIQIEDDLNHFNVITREIDHRIVGKNEGTSRAVFVVFENKHDLYRYFNSDSFVKYKQNTSILTEEANSAEKKKIINGSTSSGTITLFTKDFGRGTDFVVHDTIVSANGGVHVIQTFLSEEESEETQIIGRTARQGESGSYCLILSKTSLEKFGIGEKDFENETSMSKYEILNKKRNSFFSEIYAENIKYIEDIKKKHEDCMDFILSLMEKNMISINKFLLAENKASLIAGSSKTLILLDGTCSMYYVLDKTKKTLNEMFERVASILAEQSINESFQIKIAVFRNYNSDEAKILEQSKWESKPQNLIEFLKKIYVDGGWSNEAIEIGFWQANQEEKLSQVILIGDAPPNTKDEVVWKRRDGKFSSVKYAKPTFYLDELAVLKDNSIKVNAFYVNKQAKQSFSEIAAFTNGTCEELNIDSANGSNDLMNLVNIEVLRSIGGSAEGKQLVDAYRRKFNA